ncbi:MAG: ribosome biogenesis GTPase Der [Patescibacteria group bacterium]
MTDSSQNKNREPIIALIGLPNAGKSALMNRIIGEKKAIVADEAHTTRDVNIGHDIWEGYNLTFVDTGGLVPKAEDKIQKLVQVKSWSAIAKSDVLVWLIDRKTNPEVFSMDMLQKIWKLNKPIIIALSKVDSPMHEKDISEYARLGGDAFINLSANSGFGLNDLMDEITTQVEKLGFIRPEIEIEAVKEKPRGKRSQLKEVIAKGNYFITRNIDEDGNNLYKLSSKQLEQENTEDHDSQNDDQIEFDDSIDTQELNNSMQLDYMPKILLLGKPNVGKSSLINSLFNEEKQIVSDIPGTTLSVNDFEYQAENGNKYSFIDSTGIRKKGSRTFGAETFATYRTIEAAYSCDAILFIMDASQAISHQDMVIGGICKEAHKGLVILANKMDLLDADQKKVFQTDLFKKFEFLKSEDVVFISATEKTNLESIFLRIDDVLQRRSADIEPKELRKVFNYLMKQRKPPKLPTKRKAVCYDLIQTKNNPPTFEFLVKDKSTIHWSYVRFLENLLRKQFKLNNTGVKVRITEVINKNVEK